MTSYRAQRFAVLGTTLLFLVSAVPGCSRVPRQKLGYASEPSNRSGNAPLTTSTPPFRVPAREASWSGEIEKVTFSQVDQHFVTNSASWAAVWKLLFEAQAVPKVDFEKHLVSIDARDSNDPNTQQLTFVADESGMLTAEVTATEIGFSSSRSVKFEIHLVPRKGIRKCRSFDADRNRYVFTPVR